MDRSQVPIDRAGLLSRARRAFNEFLAVPSLVMLAFVALAGGSIWLDRSAPGWVQPVRDLLERHMFRETSATNSFLGMVTTGLITMTSITFSMLLLALQQSASLIGAQVVNSFLLRRRNQALLGFFLGLTLFVLVVRAATNSAFNPILGAILALLLTMAALYALAFLVFAAINQMRPQEVISEVRTQTLQARRQQRELLLASYREPRFLGGTEVRVQTDRHGYLRDIDLKPLREALRTRRGEVEVEVRLEIGDYVAYGDELARVRAAIPEEAERLARAAREALVLDYQRATRRDPSFGVQQILMIGWSSGSTAYQNPGIALDAIRNLRDIIARWCVDYDAVEGSPGTLPLVYPDGLAERAVDALGAFGVVSTESLQFLAFEEVMRAYVHVFGQLPEHLQDRVAATLRRLVTGLGDHVLTCSLEDALEEAERTFREEGYADAADALQTARRQMVSVAGTLAARSNRAQLATDEQGGGGKGGSGGGG